MPLKNLIFLIISFVKAVFSKPKLALLSLIGLSMIGSTWYFYEIKIARPAMIYMGVPHETSGHAQNIFNRVFRNQAYMVGYSENLRNPLWVSYKITQNKSRIGKRPPFRADWRSPFGVDPDDFRRSGFDRGHMAPNFAIGSRHGRSAQVETFLMTNISPQKGSLNRKSWQRLEEVATNHFSKKFPEIWVITGPIFDSSPKTIKNTSIAIPKAFYKIFIVPTKNEPEHEQEKPKVLAMIFPQTAKPNASLLEFVSNVDEVERLTGLDFFWQLSDGIENNIEQSKNYQDWNLRPVARLKNRY